MSASSPDSAIDLRKIDIDTKTTAPKIELFMSDLFRAPSRPHAEIRLARNLSNEFFAETWASILIGSAARSVEQLTVRDWQKHQTDITQVGRYICSSAPALTAIAMGAKLESADHQDISISRSDVEKAICSRRLPLVQELSRNITESMSPYKLRGMLRTARGESSTVCEFDPNYSLADLFGGEEHYDIRSPQVESLVRNRIAHFRRELEFGARKRNIAVDRQFSWLTSFLVELHQNSYLYGRHGAKSSESGTRIALDGIRFLRLKKYIGTNQELVARANGLPPLQAYLKRALKGSSSVIIEASVSDFGLGIVDFIRTSSIADWYSGVAPRDILRQAFLGQVTTQSADPAAGAGIYRALLAVHDINGFVSLRTGEFWLQKSFEYEERKEIKPDLDDMLPGQPLAPVAGTHWFLFYHQNLS